jgi:hypothetical protein
LIVLLRRPIASGSACGVSPQHIVDLIAKHLEIVARFTLQDIACGVQERPHNIATSGPDVPSTSEGGGYVVRTSRKVPAQLDKITFISVS